MTAATFDERRRAADASFLYQGITFTVYAEEEGVERVFPFDLVPRIIPDERMEPHRARAAPARDRAEPVPARRLPRPAHPHRAIDPRRARLRGPPLPPRDDRRGRAAQHLRARRGHRPRARRRGHVLRPRGQRALALRRELHAGEPPGHEAGLLRACSRGTACARSSTTRRSCWPPCARSRPRPPPIPPCVLLTPGTYNSAYFEHSFLARQMGIEIVEGRDLVVHDDRVFMRTTQGLQAGGRHLPAGGRRLPRPPGLPRRQPARRGRPHERLPRGQRHPGQRGGHRASPTTRPSTPTCRR